MHELCVVFDVDDTLYLERDYVVSGFRAAGEWAAEWLSIPDFGERCIELFRNGCRGNIFNTALEVCGHPAPPDLIAGFVAIYRSHRPQIALLDDARLAIEQIHQRWPIAVITDGPVLAQSRKCKALELSRWADPIILTGTRGESFHKPQRGAFDFVVSRVPASAYVYVADNPAKDFTGPHQLGWRSIRIRRKHGLHYATDSGVVVPGYELPDCANLVSTLSELRFTEAIHTNFTE